MNFLRKGLWVWKDLSREKMKMVREKYEITVVRNLYECDTDMLRDWMRISNIQKK